MWCGQGETTKNHTEHRGYCGGVGPWFHYSRGQELDNELLTDLCRRAIDLSVLMARDNSHGVWVGHIQRSRRRALVHLGEGIEINPGEETPERVALDIGDDPLIHRAKFAIEHRHQNIEVGGIEL